MRRVDKTFRINRFYTKSGEVQYAIQRIIDLQPGHKMIYYRGNLDKDIEFNEAQIEWPVPSYVRLLKGIRSLVKTMEDNKNAKVYKEAIKIEIKDKPVKKRDGTREIVIKHWKPVECFNYWIEALYRPGDLLVKENMQ